jgi:hypothetical protein
VTIRQQAALQVARTVNTGAAALPPAATDHLAIAASPTNPALGSQDLTKRKASCPIDGADRTTAKPKLVSILKAPGSPKKVLAVREEEGPPPPGREGATTGNSQATQPTQATTGPDSSKATPTDPGKAEAKATTTAATTEAAQPTAQEGSQAKAGAAKGAEVTKPSPPAPGVDSPTKEVTDRKRPEAPSPSASSSDDNIIVTKPLRQKRRVSAPPQPTGFKVMAPNGTGKWSRVRLDCPLKSGKATKKRWQQVQQDLQPQHVVVMFSNNSLSSVLAGHIRPLDETKLGTNATVAGR